jgi:hypothetical protein
MGCTIVPMACNYDLRAFSLIALSSVFGTQRDESGGSNEMVAATGRIEAISTL